MIRATDWGYTFEGQTWPAVQHIDFEVEQGERVLLLGPSGSGKSTLLTALAGLLGSQHDGVESGSLLIDGVHPSRMKGQVGLVMQDPQSQVILQRVGDDVAFGLENMGVSPDRIWPRVEAALQEVGLEVPLNRPTAALSGGQQQRLILAATLAMQDEHHRILCLDEPTANLDTEGIAEIRDATKRALTADATLIIVEHRVEPWLDVVDRLIVIGHDGVIADGPVQEVLEAEAQRLLDAGVWVPGNPTGLSKRDSFSLGTTAGSSSAGSSSVSSSSESTSFPTCLRTVDLTTGHGKHVVSTGLDLKVESGVSTVITGPNGVGKSTLAMTLAGLLPPVSGRVEATEVLDPPKGRLEIAKWASKDLLTRVGTVFQQPEHQFVESTVARELEVGMRALGWDDKRIGKRRDYLLDMLRMTDLADRNPFQLSGGQARRLSVATVLATSPKVMILDEPTFGQDRNTWLGLCKLIQELIDEGHAVVSVTHDEEFIDVLGERHIHLDSGGDHPEPGHRGTVTASGSQPNSTETGVRIDSVEPDRGGARTAFEAGGRA